MAPMVFWSTIRIAKVFPSRLESGAAPGGMSTECFRSCPACLKFPGRSCRELFLNLADRQWLRAKLPKVTHALQS
ncbi:uncharacterized [Tachysurus ichikawai]